MNLKNENLKFFMNQNYNQLKNDCILMKKNYQDEMFPAKMSSIFKFNNEFIKNEIKIINWKRPKEFLKSPRLKSLKNICQGKLGNCWFISALISLSSFEEYFKTIIPDDNQLYDDENYCGIFHFRFWRFGVWMDVCIDDRLPVDENNSLIFCSNKIDPNDVLGSLIEKAFAKLVSCYEFLNGGESIDALIDLTGSFYYEHVKLFKLRLIDNDIRKKKRLWNLLLDSYFNKSALVTASIKNSRDNLSFDNKLKSLSLVIGHSYSIIEIVEIFSNSKLRQSFKNENDDSFDTSSIKLLKLRNPLGDSNSWLGKFSSKSTEWSKIDSNILNKILNQNELEFGYFFIDFDDFYNLFDEIFFNYVQFDYIFGKSESWHQKVVKVIYDQFLPNINSGGSGKLDKSEFWQNPQYLINLRNIKLSNRMKNSVNVVISIMQMDQVLRRLKNGGDYSESNLPLKETSSFKQYNKDRYNSEDLIEIYHDNNYYGQRQKTKKFKLDINFNYVIMPSLFEKNLSMKYLLRIYIQT